VLAVRESDDRPLYTRAYASSLRAGEWLVGPKHTAWKLAGVAVIVATLLVTLVRTEYRVEAPVEIQPRARAIVAAPFAGVIATLGEGIAPGRAVKKGDVLLELDTREIQLRILDSSAKMTQAQKEADAALKAGNRQSEFQQAQARAAQAEAGLRRAQLELELATLRAPIDGTIIAGDLQDRVGASIQQGDALFQIAALDDMLVVARLSDRDIALVRDQFSDKGPSTGDVATKASPADRRPFVVERIVPLAQAKDGKNAFEVRGRLTTPVPGLRPGMEGIAKFNVGRHSILYIGTRRIHDQLRLWLWW
jgi:multidrug efflux pump subunit AcrA (membrane-fusion protein)